MVANHLKERAKIIQTMFLLGKSKKLNELSLINQETIKLLLKSRA